MGDPELSVPVSPNASGGSEDMSIFAFHDDDETFDEVKDKPIDKAALVEIENLVSSMNKQECRYAQKQIKRRLGLSENHPHPIPTRSSTPRKKEQPAEQTTEEGLKYHKGRGRAVAYEYDFAPSDKDRGRFQEEIKSAKKFLQDQDLPKWVTSELDPHGNFRSQVQSLRLFSYTVYIHSFPNGGIPDKDLTDHLKKLNQITHWSHHSEFDVSFSRKQETGTHVINGESVTEMTTLLKIFVARVSVAWVQADRDEEHFVNCDLPCKVES